MPIAVSPTQSDIHKALGQFLEGILPSGIEIFVGQANRVPEPQGENFVIMTPIRRDRLETNFDAVFGCGFTGSIAGSTLTIDAIDYGEITIGALVVGAGVDSGLTIAVFGTGTGGEGTYTLSGPQAVAVAGEMFAGGRTVSQQTRVVIQLDVHGPAGADNSQIISTLFRDPFGVDAFAATNAAISPLYADDPRQLPFIPAEEQYEDRWVIEAHLQVSELVYGIPQQFAAFLDLTLIEVEAFAPAPPPGAGPSLDFTLPGNSMYIPPII